MAGKLHKDYVRYTTSGGQVLAPQGKRFLAYAEGFNAKRKGLTQIANPHPAWQTAYNDSDWNCWDQGWSDANTAQPPTHVGPET